MVSSQPALLATRQDACVLRWHEDHDTFDSLSTSKMVTPSSTDGGAHGRSIRPWTRQVELTATNVADVGATLAADGSR